MAKYKEIKRNHHYVWSFYLKSWAIGKDLFYISSNGKISKDSVKGLAKETDFYKINILNSDDVEYIKRFSLKSPNFLHKIHMSHLQYFINISNISNMIINLKTVNEEINLVSKSIESNSLENLHSTYESAVTTVFRELSNGNEDILSSDKNMSAFCSYIGHQISRTKAIKEKCIMAIKAEPTFAPKKYVLLFEKNWWFLSFMFGLNLGSSLYQSKEKMNHIFITNNTGTPFITSDNPIVNVHSSLSELDQGEEPSFSDFFIPLSPKYAYMINDSDSYNHLKDSISVKDVVSLNIAVYKKSYKNVFASESSVLKSIKAMKR